VCPANLALEIRQIEASPGASAITFTLSTKKAKYEQNFETNCRFVSGSDAFAFTAGKRSHSTEHLSSPQTTYGKENS
jgi:hypothetical protein